MPKLKTRKAAAKRFKATGTGKFLRRRAFRNHLLDHHRHLHHHWDMKAWFVMLLASIPDPVQCGFHKANNSMFLRNFELLGIQPRECEE